MKDDKLSKLHDMLCDELLARLKNGEEDAEGNVTKVKAPTLNVIRQFLKDNNVDALPADGSHLGKLVDELPPEFRVKN